MGSLGSARWRDLGVRTVSALVLIPVVLAAVWVGGVWFTLLVAVLGVSIAYEWTGIVHERSAPQFVLHAAAAIAGALIPAAAGIPTALAVIAILAGISITLDFARRGGRQWGALGVPYAGLPAVAFVVLRADQAYGGKAVFWLLLVVWTTDMGAYFAGRLIGGPKLAPTISPHKTWAGALGALTASMLVGAIAAQALVGSFWGPALLAIVLSLAAQTGDLFKSVLKRRYRLKDSGTLIPGHGGIIDRVDGLLAAALIAAITGLVRGGPGFTGEGLLLW